MQNILRSLALLGLLGLAACGPTWSTSSVEAKPATGGPTSNSAATPAATQPDMILVVETDLTDRPYTVLGDISVTVNKTTLFHPDPTREQVTRKLREEAAKIGADAVILVRYGTPGISMMSWGSMDGKGRAVAYRK
jgi:hypothetical protein